MSLFTCCPSLVSPPGSQCPAVRVPLFTCLRSVSLSCLSAWLVVSGSPTAMSGSSDVSLSLSPFISHQCPDPISLLLGLGFSILFLKMSALLCQWRFLCRFMCLLHESVTCFPVPHRCQVSRCAWHPSCVFPGRCGACCLLNAFPFASHDLGLSWCLVLASCLWLVSHHVSL